MSLLVYMAAALGSGPNPAASPDLPANVLMIGGVPLQIGGVYLTIG